MGTYSVITPGRCWRRIILLAGAMLLFLPFAVQPGYADGLRRPPDGSPEVLADFPGLAMDDVALSVICGKGREKNDIEVGTLPAVILWDEIDKENQRTHLSESMGPGNLQKNSLVLTGR